MVKVKTPELHYQSTPKQNKSAGNKTTTSEKGGASSNAPPRSGRNVKRTGKNGGGKLEGNQQQSTQNGQNVQSKRRDNKSKQNGKGDAKGVLPKSFTKKMDYYDFIDNNAFERFYDVNGEIVRRRIAYVAELQKLLIAGRRNSQRYSLPFPGVNFPTHPRFGYCKLRIASFADHKGMPYEAITTIGLSIQSTIDCGDEKPDESGYSLLVEHVQKALSEFSEKLGATGFSYVNHPRTKSYGVTTVSPVKWSRNKEGTDDDPSS